MTEVIVKLFILLTGFGMGFLLACLGASRIIAEKHDLKVKLARVEAEKAALEKKSEVKVIEIHDDRVGNDVEFGGF